jgi:hypothetical protein
MHGVVVAPVAERLEDEQAGEPPEPEVRPLSGQKRAVGAVVEDDERAQEKTGRGNGEGKRDPNRDVETEIHGDAQGQVGHSRGEDVEKAVPERGLLMPSDRVLPIRRHEPGDGIRAS